MAAFSEAKVRQVKGIACISAVAGTASETVVYKNSGIFGEMEPDSNNGTDIPVLFVDRKTGFPSDFIGFDYEKPDRPWQRRHCRRDIEASVCLQEIRIIPVKKISAGVSLTRMEGSACQVIRSGQIHLENTIISCRYLTERCLRRFYFNYGFAESAKDMCTTFMGKEGSPDIYTVSPLFTIPENDFIKYEMNYRRWENGRRRYSSGKQKKVQLEERMQQEKYHGSR